MGHVPVPGMLPGIIWAAPVRSVAITVEIRYSLKLAAEQHGYLFVRLFIPRHFFLHADPHGEGSFYWCR